MLVCQQGTDPTHEDQSPPLTVRRPARRRAGNGRALAQRTGQGAVFVHSPTCYTTRGIPETGNPQQQFAEVDNTRSAWVVRGPKVSADG